MIKENAIVQLGEKGGKLVLAVLKKINDQKEKFRKPATGSIQALKDEQTLQQRSEQAKLEQNRQDVIQGGKFYQNVGKANRELQNLANSAASLDPGSVLQAAVGTVGKAATGLLSKIPFAGEYLKAFGEGATELIQAGTQMGQNALQAVKAGLPVAIDTAVRRSRLRFLGGEGLMGGAMSLGERSEAIESIASRFGKIQSNTFKDQIKRLFADRDIGQATALATGNLSALGTDKGFFLQKIADSFSGLPPSLAQELTGQLLSGIDLSEVNADAAQNARRSNAKLEDSNRALQEQIALSADNVQNLNAQFNKLQRTLVESGTVFSVAVGQAAGALNKLIGMIPGGKAR